MNLLPEWLCCLGIIMLMFYAEFHNFDSFFESSRSSFCHDWCSSHYKLMFSRVYSLVLRFSAINIPEKWANHVIMEYFSE